MLTLVQRSPRAYRCRARRWVETARFSMPSSAICQCVTASSEAKCTPSAQVGQFQAIEEETVFGSSITAEGAGDEIENRYATGRSGEGGTRYKAGDPAALFG